MKGLACDSLLDQLALSTTSTPSPQFLVLIMPVASAEMLVAQAKEERTRRNGPTPGVPSFMKSAPRRDKKPNPTTAGAPNAAKARMDYFLAGPQPLGRASARPIPKPTNTSRITSFAADMEVESGSYDEFILVSAPRDDWKHSIMTFKPANKDAKVDIKAFEEPIKLNRKNPTGIIYAPNDADQNAPSKPMLGADGQAVYHNGQIVMMNAEGQTAISITKAKNAAVQKGKGKANEPAGGPSKKKIINKPKLKQTFKAADSVRQLRKEEYFPWVLEDEANNQEWVGTMDATNEKVDHALFSVDSSKGVFEFVPVHRFYNFLPKRQVVARMRAEEAHEMVGRYACIITYGLNQFCIQQHMKGKNVDMVTWMKKRNGGTVSAATVKTQAKAIKTEAKAMRRPKREQDDDDLFGDRGRGDEVIQSNEAVNLTLTDISGRRYG